MYALTTEKKEISKMLLLAGGDVNHQAKVLIYCY